MLEKSLKMEKTCRACTKTEPDLVSLFDKQNDPDGICYSDMITECTMYSVLEDDALPHLICSDCCDKVRVAYEFKKQFEVSQKKLLALVESMKEITTEPVETIFYNCNDKLRDVNDDEPISSKRSTRNSSSKRNDSSGHNVSQEDSLNDEKNASVGKPRPNECPICSKEFVRMGHLKNHLNKFHKNPDKPNIGDTVEKVVVKFETTEFIISAINQVKSVTKPESDADAGHFDDLGPDNEEGAINCPDTESIKSFEAEFDISDSKINIIEISKIGETKQEKDTNEDKKESAKQEKIKKTRGKGKNTIHGERRFQCEECNKSFKRSSHLKQHFLCHTKLKLHECTICHKKFGRSDNLKVHMSNHGKRLFGCDICGRSFGQAYLLNRHKFQTHSEEKPFLCSECGQRFVRNGDLAVHMRRHTGEKPYKCQFCNKGFTRSTEVYVHERYHTGEKNHVCNICGKAFQRPYNLVVHVRTHTGERPYQCPHCPKNFAQCSDLKAHIRRHTGERYKCDQCSMGFIHVFVLNQHKRNVHGIDVPTRIVRIAKLNKEALNPPVANEPCSPESKTLQTN